MKLRAAARAAVLAAAALGAYGTLEAKRYRRREYTIAALPPGADPMRVLHVSDLHLAPSNRALIKFVEALGDETYDLVFATGDFLSEPESVDICARLLNGLRGKDGRFFVLGSSDYFAPTFKTYFEYFMKVRRHGVRRNPTPKFRAALVTEGWHDMTNRNLTAECNGTTIQITGLDDPYLGWDDRSLVKRDPAARLGICVVHDPGPYREAIEAGYDLVISGHTHGGQVRFPFVGAVVTNSTLPTRLARGLARIDSESPEAGRQDGYLFVTPGLGVSKFAPFRFLCPPEASILNLVPSEE